VRVHSLDHIAVTPYGTRLPAVGSSHIFLLADGEYVFRFNVSGGVGTARNIDLSVDGSASTCALRTRHRTDLRIGRRGPNATAPTTIRLEPII